MAETAKDSRRRANSTHPAAATQELTADLQRWEDAGLITPEQRGAIARLRHVSAELRMSSLDGLVAAGLITRAQARAIRAAEPWGQPAPPGPGRPLPGSSATLTVSPQPVTPRRAQRLLDPRRLGVLLAALALAGLGIDLLGITTDVFIAPWRLGSADLGDGIQALASVVALVGASLMVRNIASGKGLVAVSLVVNILLTLLSEANRLSDPLEMAAVGGWVALLYATLLSGPRSTPGAQPP